MDKKSLVKYLFIIVMIGMVYLSLEAVWKGWTHVSMLFVGGICGLFIGLLNQKTNLKVYKQVLVGLPAVLTIELFSGLFINKYLGFAVWDYSDKLGNVLGQICPQYSILWVLLIPFGIWLDDYIRWKWFNEGSYYPIYENYIELITLR
ncbi:Protein of unknown function (DUF1113) [Desulfitobacterium dehalogenans ATCC 51507]|uniref:ABC-transporter type IV n=1 Tax=Desulfitobacterium dehalogenans (strain ATCC 51507 / DSM 9161 / JW/IU-DC1) TaxID=756499 RepID=I4AEK6_DESDJ|nr:hypothetical protein [Desulfitobacterium dehalogenans]AFM02391.1 Protein of unknown function (DUF1113) [Desulfitobacterium dehalogenans ATCC 51507]